MAEAEMIEMNRGDVEVIVGFLSGVSGVTCLPCDEPLKGIGGYYIYRAIGSEEISVYLGWRMGKPVKDIIDVTLDNAEPLLTRCIEDEWEICDDPKLLRRGFMRHANIDSDEESIAVEIGMVVFQSLPDELQQRITQYCEHVRKSYAGRQRARLEWCLIPSNETKDVQ